MADAIRMKEQGKSYREIAAALAVSKSAVSRWLESAESD
jgi:transposase